MEKLLKILSNIKVIAVAGIFLLIQLILMLSHKTIKYFDFGWITLILCAIPIYYWAILYLFKYKKIISSTLISIAITALIIKSIIQYDHHDMFAASEVAFLASFGEFIEEKTINRAKRGLHKLIELQPKFARIVNNNNLLDVEIEKINIGDTVRVLQGERIPVDGVVIKGNTQVDQSVVTGESLPIDKEEGSKVYTATLNISEPIDIKVSSKSENSSFSRLLKLLKDAEENKSPTQRTVDKWTVYIVPLALIISLVSFVIFYFISKNIDLAINRSITILVVFCPCAMLLATPVAIVASVAQATKFGFIIKSGQALEEFSKIDTICIDKTGTLTEGRLSLSKVINIDIEKNELLKFASSAEQNSNHPIAKILKEETKNLNIELLKTSNFQNLLGKGIKAEVENSNILCGNEKLLNDNSVVIEKEYLEIADSLREKGEYVIFISINNLLKGIISFNDKLNTNAKLMVKRFKKENIKVILLSGDDKKTVKYIANELSIDTYYSNCLPEDKVRIVKELKQNNHKVAMFGDGINDSIALKESNVSIAMAENGSDIAVESADIAICNSDLEKINYLSKLSKNTFRTIVINLSLSVIINVLGLSLALSGHLNPIYGALMHQLGTILVVLNAAYLYDKKIYKKMIKDKI